MLDGAIGNEVTVTWTQNEAGIQPVYDHPNRTLAIDIDESGSTTTDIIAAINALTEFTAEDKGTGDGNDLWVTDYVPNYLPDQKLNRLADPDPTDPDYEDGLDTITITINFVNEVEQASAEDVANYTLDVAGDGTIELTPADTAVRGPDNVVELTFVIDDIANSLVTGTSLIKVDGVIDEVTSAPIVDAIVVEAP